ncbi:probable citrate synthase 2, mitochondrial isoform X2 [Belonocnema kinseyi]|uniref:probable citrate synthase 2, mitochondrial isoform X2 n=1 Tax=Belonocnema kinseyi TaxID=2817044 RepID=UPI00143DB2A4|nr:probable citrate synthase 2, mitochondrial isoform X2 [Belonocnema kinseyi]
MEEVSTTKGVPSKSTDLKEALCEKIPLQYDLLRKIRRQHGSTIVSQITIDDIFRGLRGVNTIIRETSEVDSKLGIQYRGLTIPEVLTLLPRRGSSPSPEAVFWLLLTGDVPTMEQTESLIADWSARREKRKEWWLEAGDGGIVGAVLKSLPKTVTPLRRLSIALTTLDADKHTKSAIKNGAMKYTHWEYIYEDSMEILATLPAIVCLTGPQQSLKFTHHKEGDWVDFLLDCIGNISHIGKEGKKSLGEFLRLYIAVNADDDGGIPGAHVTQILGTAQPAISQALAAGIPAYFNEPRTGTMSQYVHFQTKVQSVFGVEPEKDALKSFLSVLVDKSSEIVAHKESEFGDSRYNALREFARENLPNDPRIKLSQDISGILSAIRESSNKKKIWPEESAIAAPIFELYGLKDMEFNQVFLCMSRALGAVASIIWAKALDTPVEWPKSKCTYSYLENVKNYSTK